MRINRKKIREGLYLHRKSVGVVILCILVVAVNLSLASCGAEEEMSLVSTEAVTEAVTEEAAVEETVSFETAETAVSSSPVSSTTICVYVCGAVASPGVYTLPEGARVYEALNAAGGLTEEAYGEAVNQAAVLSDGDMITIPTTEEMESGTTASGVQSSGTTGVSSSTGESSGKININTASATELEEIPGVGPAKAQAIIEYRETNGPFTAPEDLMKITGIKEKTFAKMKDSVCVN